MEYWEVFFNVTPWPCCVATEIRSPKKFSVCSSSRLRHSLYKLLCSLSYFRYQVYEFYNKSHQFDVISFLHYLLHQCFYNQCLQITYLWLQNVFYQMIDDFEPSNIQNPHVVSGFKETHSSWFMVCFFN
jgi:hypothetical protein